jgi:hypothetical protein
MIISSIDSVKSLPSPALGLLPAIHDASVEVFLGSASLPLGTAANEVMVNGSGATFTLPAFNSWPPQRVRAGEFFGTDGRFYYPLVRYKETNSFYPAAFERNLYTLAFTPESLPVGGLFSLNRTLDLRMFNNTSDAVWTIVWEIGMVAAQTEPAPVGPNLEGYIWRRPLIEQKLHITDVVKKHTFGVILRRSIVNQEEVFVGDIIRYNKALGALPDQLPTGPNFVLRIKLAYFDTENDVPEPRGFVAYYCHGGDGEK